MAKSRNVEGMSTETMTIVSPSAIRKMARGARDWLAWTNSMMREASNSMAMGMNSL
jgi:hypothetical protein